MKKIEWRVFTALLIAIMLTGCAGISRNVSNFLFPPFPSSDQRKGEEVTLVIDTKKKETDFVTDTNCIAVRDEGDDSKINSMFFLGLALPAASVVMDFAIKQTQQFLEDEAKRYTATYSASAFGDRFYYFDNCVRLGGNKLIEVEENGKLVKKEIKKGTILAHDQRINLEKLILKRTIYGGKAAMDLTIGIEAVKDGTAFRIQPISVTVTKTKAKVAAFDFTRPLGFDLLAPWTILQLNSPSELWPIRDPIIDLTADITLHAVWVDEKGIGHSEDVASKQIKIRNLEIGKPKDLKGTLDTELFPAIPQSVIGRDIKNLGYGNYVVKVVITEYDSFAERVTEIKKAVDSNKDNLKKLIPE